MNRSDIITRSMELITSIYSDSIKSNLDSFSDDCIWIGPYSKQVLFSKKKVVDLLDSRNRDYKFDILDMDSIPVAISQNCIEIILIYHLNISYPDGTSSVILQRAQLVWVKKHLRDQNGADRSDFVVRSCHLSNEMNFESHGTTPAADVTDADKKDERPRMTPSSGKRIYLKGPKSSTIYLSENDVIRLKSSGSHTTVFTVKGEFTSSESINDIVGKYPDIFVRCHISHAVNLNYIAEVKRFKVTLKDGTQVNIPEKRYTVIRDDIQAKMRTLK